MAQAIDEKIIFPIDANDNGVNIYSSTVRENFLPYTLQDLIFIFRATWKENPAQNDAVFLDMVAFAKKILLREIEVNVHEKEARALVEKNYQDAEDKRIKVLNDKYPWMDVITKHPEPLFVIYPDPVNQAWRVKAVGEDTQVFIRRKDLPAAGGGKTGQELADITGVPDAVFCHKALFLAGAKSKEGALALAKLALEA